MFKFCSYFYQYIQLIYSVNNYIHLYQRTSEHDIILLDSIINRIKSCGSVAIKFCQWITPKLEIMYLEEENIINEVKPIWLKRLESLYENCVDHSIEYTLSHYDNIFKSNFNEDYEILDIIGSGSIGQVYLIQDKPLTKYSEKKKYIMKILHPNVKYEINFFRKFYTIVKYIPQVKQILNEKFPFDIYNFIEQFSEQSDFINESNHLLHFMEQYSNNDFIIIPELIKCSKSIMIMSYEEGIPYDDLNINKYQKYKIALLLASFVRNNQHILNYHHGDLHKANWKVRLNDDGLHKLIIYDFGFCWKVPSHKIGAINKITSIFEDSDSDPETINLNDMIDVFRYLLKYDNEERINISIRTYLENNMNSIKPWVVNPSRLFKMTVNLCISENLLIDPILIQTIIILIQCQIIFEEFRMISSDKDEIQSYEVFRSKYLDLITFYKTYNIFTEYTDFIYDLLNEKQTEIDNIFDCIEMSDSIKQLALENKLEKKENKVENKLEKK